MIIKLSFKRILVFPLLAVSVCANAATTDTIVLTSNVRDSIQYNKVYINENRNAADYNSIRLFESKKSEWQGVKKAFPFGQWVSLKIYNDSFYLYRPCDLGYNFHLEITKKVYRIYTFEPEEQMIRSIKQISPDKYLLDLEVLVYPGKRRKVALYLVNRKQGIAVIENLGSRDEWRYQLMVDAAKVKQFPIIINECTAKSFEFEFKTPDYAALLKKFTR